MNGLLQNNYLAPCGRGKNFLKSAANLKIRVRGQQGDEAIKLQYNIFTGKTNRGEKIGES